MSATPILAVGELLTEFISLREGCGLTRTGRFAGPFASGAPAIFLDQAARMGARTFFIGGVGRDGFGNLIRDKLEEDGVDTRWIADDPDRPTGTAFVSYYADGSRDFIFHLKDSAADSFAMPDKLAGVLAEFSPPILHISGSSLGNRAIRARIEEALRIVLSLGGRISVDPNVRKELYADAEAFEALQAALSRASFILPSQEDIDILLPGRSLEAAIAHFHGLGADIVAVKRGPLGCVLSDGDVLHEIEGLRVEKIVDPTGAGDCFCGTLIAALAGGRPLAEAGRLANAAGALSVMRRGPMEGNSRPPRVRKFLREQAAQG